MRTEDDLGALARSFNTMAESVQSQLTIRNNAGRLTQAMIAAKRLQQFQSTLLEKLMEVTDAPWAFSITSTRTAITLKRRFPLAFRLRPWLRLQQRALKANWAGF